MEESFAGLSREQECERILKLCGSDHRVAIDILDRQFRLLHNRAHVLLALCGALLSTSVVLMTGKVIGATHLIHREVVVPLLVGAGAAEILSAAIVVGGVLNVRWSTELTGDDLRGWVMTSLRYRDSKTFAYRASITVLLVSMALFQAAATLVWIEL